MREWLEDFWPSIVLFAVLFGLVIVLILGTYVSDKNFRGDCTQRGGHIVHGRVCVDESGHFLDVKEQ